MKYVGIFEKENDKVKIMNVEMTGMNVEDALVSVAILMQETVAQCARRIRDSNEEMKVDPVAGELYDNMIEKIHVLKTIPLDESK